MKKKRTLYPHVEIGIVVIIVLQLIALVATLYYQYQQPRVTTSDVQELLPATTTDPYLHEETLVIVDDETTGTTQAVPVEKVLFEYVEVTGGCGPHYEGDCLNVRSQPSITAPVVAQLRNGMVLKVGGKVLHEGTAWYQIVFDEWLRYPERVTNDWYVAAEYVQVLFDEGPRTTAEHGNGSSTKHILVDRSDQMLYAYEGDELFMETAISTGLELSPTPRGNFTIFRKTPSRYMQGPLPYLANSDYYDLPGVPWNLYFTEGGAVIHGAYWHESFGQPYSHGCVNLAPNIARQLYEWAELGTPVVVRD